VCPNYSIQKQDELPTKQTPLMLIEAFGGIVKFNQKDAKATVSGHLTSLESCDVIKEGDQGYKEALSIIIETKKESVKKKHDTAQKEI